MIHLFADYINDHFVSESNKKAIASVANNASYRQIDEYELGFMKRLMAIESGAMLREELELILQWIRWTIAGKCNFIIGPETSKKITDRLKAGDIPTDPVAPAYIEFETPIVNYAPSQPLIAGMISRGVLGRITFMGKHFKNDLPVEEMCTTVLLPSVFRNDDIDRLKKNMAAAKKTVRNTKSDAYVLAENMAKSQGVTDPEIIAGIAANFGSLSDTTNLETGPVLDVVASLIHESFGPLPDKPNGLLPKAARVMLIAADEARKANEEYGKPDYINTTKIERNWIESPDHPVQVRTAPIYLR